MKVIRCNNDLAQLGITYLTGEACSLGIRFLAELTEEASLGICEFLGISPRQHYERMMIPYAIVQDLAASLMIREGAEFAFTKVGGDGLYGFYPEDEDRRGTFEKFKEQGRILKIYQVLVPNQPRQGLNNVSAFTGTAI